MATPAEEAPAKRNDIRVYEKSKYKAKGQNGKKRGGFSRSQQGMYAKETASGTKRNTHKGMSELDSLVSYSLSEAKQPNYYDQEEERLFKENYEIRTLIESLEKNK